MKMTYKEAALKLCDGFLDMPSGCDGCPLATENYDEDGNMICQLNDVDAVPVVRCKDCKFNEDCIRRIEFMGRNPVLEMNTYEYHPLDFCSYGEPKEETP